MMNIMRWLLACCLMAGYADGYCMGGGRPFQITVKVCDGSPMDTAKLMIYAHGLETMSEPTVLTAALSSKGSYEFKTIRYGRPLYVTLAIGTISLNTPNPILIKYLAEPGDSVQIDIEKDPTAVVQGVLPFQYTSAATYNIQFSGKGAAKYTCRFTTDKVLSAKQGNTVISYSNNRFAESDFFDICATTYTKVLGRFKSKMTNEAFQVLRFDYDVMLAKMRMNALPISQLNKKDSIAFRTALLLYMKKEVSRELAVPESIKLISAEYPSYVIDRVSIEKLKPGNSRKLQPENVASVYHMLKRGYNNELRDKILTVFFLRLNGSGFEALMADALQVVKTPYYANELNQFYEANAIGRPAYNFSLTDMSGKDITLSSLKGKVVFIDFWFTGCSGCRQYFAEVLSDVEKHFTGNDGVAFVSVSVDADKETWTEGVKSGKYTSGHAINLYTNGLGAEHPVIKNYRVDSYPKPLLIGKDGKIFNNRYEDLRSKGREGLILKINEALQQ